MSDTNKICVLFFGATADAVGERETEINIDGGERLDSVMRSLIESYPQLSGLKLLAALNEEYAPQDRVVASGDTIAIFTPVSGG